MISYRSRMMQTCIERYTCDTSASGRLFDDAITGVQNLTWVQNLTRLFLELENYSLLKRQYSTAILWIRECLFPLRVQFYHARRVVTDIQPLASWYFRTPSFLGTTYTSEVELLVEVWILQYGQSFLQYLGFIYTWVCELSSTKYSVGNWSQRIQNLTFNCMPE